MFKILILGGGFGGIRCALDLEKKITHSTHSTKPQGGELVESTGSVQNEQAQITLVDRNSYHLFLPSLYEVATAMGIKKDFFSVKMRKTICIPFREIFAGKNINFIQAEISALDLKTKIIRTKGGEVLSYDYLVIAIGSQTTDFGIAGVRDYAYQFKSIEDAIAINEKIGKLFEKIVLGKKIDSIKILIGGAGFTGIEFAAEVSYSIKKICRHNHIKNKNVSIILIEAGPKILPMISDSERKIIYKRLTKLGVILMENSSIEEVGNNFVKMKNGQILDGDMVVWTAGIKANEFLKSIAGLPLTDNGKVVTDVNLRTGDFKNVFAVGDNAEFIDLKTQKSVPALAYTAVDQGKIVAKNILRLINNKKLYSYEPFYGVWIAPVGGKFAIAHLWSGFGINGFLGWIVREIIDFRYLLSILTFSKGIHIFWQKITMNINRGG